MRIDQIAIASVSTRQDGLLPALDASAAAGFRNVEFVLSLVKDWLAESHSVADVRRALDSRGLRAIGGFETHLVCFGTDAERRANHALHLANARLIHELGGGTLVLGTDGPDVATSADLAPIAMALRDLAQHIADLDVQIALEFNWSPVVRSLASAVRAVELADHPHVGVLFDTAHYYSTVTKFSDLTPEAVRWIKHVHLNDMRAVPGDLCDPNSDRVVPGEGILDLPGLIGALEQGGYTGFYAIELFNDELWALPPEEAARRCYAGMLRLATNQD